MPRKTEYYCDHAHMRVPVRGEKILCEYYRTSEIQTWCAMGRCPAECSVENAISNGEPPSPTPQQYFRNLHKIANQSRREVLAYQRALAKRDTDFSGLFEKLRAIG